MSARFLLISTAIALACGASVATADHNSKNGAGWANMPNDIHNTRVETLEANDNEAFRDFVKYGEGSESENSESDGITAKRTKAQEGKSETAEVQEKRMAGAQNNDRVKEQRRVRPDTASGKSARERSATQRSDASLADRQRTHRQRQTGRGGR
jgi:hypothetical protein